MNIELTRIAEKKLDQMGATVHGVLVRNEAGAWAAVSEAGRVMWLHNFEGRDSSAQPEQPSVGVVPEVGARHPEVIRWRNNAIKASAKIADAYGCDDAAADIRAMLTAAPTAPAVQGAEPVAFQFGRRHQYIANHWPPENLRDPNVRPLYTRPHNGEQGGEWVRCEQDAKRYRWLRDNGYLNIWWSVEGPDGRCENIDEDIDEAMDKPPQDREGGKDAD